jgi:hypothetical protein
MPYRFALMSKTLSQHGIQTCTARREGKPRMNGQDNSPFEEYNP